MSAERALWCEVINQQVRDLCGNAVDARNAEAWIGDWPSPHFRAVCDLAEVDVVRAHRCLSALAALPREERRGSLGGSEDSPVRKIRGSLSASPR